MAQPTDPANEGNQIYRVEFEDLREAGFYEMELKRHSSQPQPILYAVNYDSRESELKRLEPSRRSETFFGSKVSLVSMDELQDQSVAGSNTEIWTQLLMALFAVLVIEQFLGWWWGRKR